jgi:hypothetical protein
VGEDDLVTSRPGSALQIAPPPPERIGRLLDNEEVATEVFRGKVTPQWVRRRLMAGRVRLGHRTVLWEEETVKRWIAKQVAGS